MLITLYRDAKEGEMTLYASSFLAGYSSTTGRITTNQTLSQVSVCQRCSDYLDINLSFSFPVQTSPLVRNGGCTSRIVMA